MFVSLAARLIRTLRNPKGSLKPITETTWLAAFAVSAVFSLVPAAANAIEVATKPGRPWETMATRTLQDLPPIAPDRGLDLYGGLQPDASRKTGFFHTQKINGRWWLIDPLGGLYVNRGIGVVRPTGADGAKAAFIEKFGSQQVWALKTTRLLQDYGFNGVGSWSDIESLRIVESPLATTKLLNFMSNYGKKRGGTYQQPGHTGYPNDVPFIFDPEFETSCDTQAVELEALKDDPYLLGYFSDNELPWSRELLLRALELPENDANYQAAIQWLRARHGQSASAKDVTAEDQSEFLGYAADHYFQTVAKAIRKHDPNHLFLGARFHRPTFQLPELFKAAGASADVVSINYYRAWTPDAELLGSWERESQKPILITEFYAKAVDTHMGNTTGAGWLVKTQRDRGMFYQNFTLGLLESPVCVGWQWFKYADNDPENKAADPSNRDSNKGIVTNRYEPYLSLLDAMRLINERAYGLIEHFDLKLQGEASKQANQTQN